MKDFNIVSIGPCSDKGAEKPEIEDYGERHPRASTTELVDF